MSYSNKNIYDQRLPSRWMRRQKHDCRIPRSEYERADDKCVAIVERAAAYVRHRPGDIGEAEFRFYKLSKALRVMFTVVELAKQVEAGGFLAYFHDEACWFAAYAAQGLEQIGASTHLKALRQAKRIFPDGKVPRNNQRRRAMLPECDVARLKRIEPCDLMRERLFMGRVDWELLKRLRKSDDEWRHADKTEGRVLEKPGLKFVEAHLDDFVS